MIDDTKVVFLLNWNIFCVCVSIDWLMIRLLRWNCTIFWMKINKTVRPLWTWTRLGFGDQAQAKGYARNRPSNEVKVVILFQRLHTKCTNLHGMPQRNDGPDISHRGHFIWLVQNHWWIDPANFPARHFFLNLKHE